MPDLTTFRPANLHIGAPTPDVVGGSGAMVSWDVMGGVGVTF